MPRSGDIGNPLPGSSQSEKVMTRQRDARASTAGAIHFHRPWMPGIITTGVPRPRSTIDTSVPQRLPGLQRVLNPFERLRLAEQTEKRLALEIEQMLLGDHGGVRQVAAGEDARQLAADQGVVVRCAPGTPCQVDAQLQR